MEQSPCHCQKVPEQSIEQTNRQRDAGWQSRKAKKEDISRVSRAPSAWERRHGADQKGHRAADVYPLFHHRSGSKRIHQPTNRRELHARDNHAEGGCDSECARRARVAHIGQQRSGHLTDAAAHEPADSVKW